MSKDRRRAHQVTGRMCRVRATSRGRAIWQQGVLVAWRIAVPTNVGDNRVAAIDSATRLTVAPPLRLIALLHGGQGVRMSEKIKVAAIQIQYPDGEVKQISVEDAKALFQQLEELFGSKTVVMPSTPIVIERDRWPRWQPMWVHETPIVRDPLPHEAPQVWCCTESPVASM